MMTDGTDEKYTRELQQQTGVAMTTDEKYAAANKLLNDVDTNIVKTTVLRKQMPLKCAQLQARRCRLQLRALVSIYLFMNSQL